MRTLRLFAFCLTVVGISPATAQFMQGTSDNPATERLTRIEYFFDTDPGYGEGYALENPQTGENTYQMSFGSLVDGAHILYVRAQEERGHWSTVASRPFIQYSHAGALAGLEYFFDTDPGYGAGYALTGAATGTNVYEMSLPDMEAGAHVLYLRAREETGNWSTVMSRPLYVVDLSAIHTTAIEYFFDDDDPGTGMATAVPLPENPYEAFTLNIPTEGLQEGQHQFNIRLKDNMERWSVLSSEPFEVTELEDGISEVVWTMPIDIRVENNVCILTDKGNTGRTNCIVRLFTTSGIQVASALWNMANGRLSIPVNVAKGSIVLVEVEDLDTRSRVVKRVVSK